MEIAILEDNEDRCQAMRALLAEWFPQNPLRIFATAAEMIRHLRLHLPGTIAIALDHDLDLIPGAPDRMFDPGTGRDVADYLATQSPVCRIVIHTTNQPAGIGMEQMLRGSAWKTKRITPYGDLEWIPEMWFPAMRNAIERGMALTDAQKKEIDRHLAAYASSPTSLIPWETVIAELERRIAAADANPDDDISWDEIVKYVRDRHARRGIERC